MADLFWAYWDATIRFALLATLLLAATPLLKRMISPRLLCWAWALLIFRLALPFSLPFSGSIFNAHENLQPSTWTEAIRRGVVNAGLGETIIPVLRDEDYKVIAMRIPVSWETALMAFWMLGVLVMAGRLLKNILQLSRFFAKSERCDEGPLFELFKDTKYWIGIYANVPLMISDQVKTPGIAGVFNPRIIVPRTCSEKLTEKEMRCVFMHELTHYRRGDLFLHHALLLLCYIHWYNPLVWLALKQFKDEMEKACDLEVVDSFCSGSAQEYGYTLLQVIQFSKGEQFSPGGALSLLGNRNSGTLKERITLIAKRRQPRPVITGIGLLFFGSSFLFAMTGEMDPQDESERLVRLTRLAGPFVEEEMGPISQAGVASESSGNVSISEDSREWVQIVEASKYSGETIRISTSVQFGSEDSTIDLWVSLDDIDERSVKFEKIRMESIGAGESSITIRVPEGAAKLKYGLTYRGTGYGWVDTLSIERLNLDS